MKIFELSQQHEALRNQLWMLDEDDPDDKLEFDRLTAQEQYLGDKAKGSILFFEKMRQEEDFEADGIDAALEQITKTMKKRALAHRNKAERYKSVELSLHQKFFGDKEKIKDESVCISRYYPGAAAVIIDDAILKNPMGLPNGCIAATMKTHDKATIERALKNENVVIEVVPIKSELKKLLPNGAERKQGIGFQTANILPGVNMVWTETLRIS